VAARSLSNGMIYVVPNLERAIACANAFAPEHLELCLADPRPQLAKIKNAGAVFLGHYTPEVLGDYYAGPNHCLPTAGTARFASALSCDDYVKSTTVLSYTEAALKRAADDVMALARLEGLEAHARAVARRLKK
jgi:histidinol dehydrogenase